MKVCNQTYISKRYVCLLLCNQSSEKPKFVWQSPRRHVFGFYWVFGFIWFLWVFYLNEQCWSDLWKNLPGKLVGWFSSSARLLFSSTNSLEYLKICKFITFGSLGALDIEKSLIVTCMTNWDWIKFGAVFCWVFSMGGFLGVYRGVWNLCVTVQLTVLNIANFCSALGPKMIKKHWLNHGWL